MTQEEALKEAEKALGASNKVLAGVGLIGAVIAVASGLDMAMSASRENDLVKQTSKSNEDMKKKQHKDNKKYGDYGLTYETYGEDVDNAKKGIKFRPDQKVVDMIQDNFVQDLYANRTGHTKMGNAKFY